MSTLDWLIVAFAALLAVFGFRRGFIVGVLSFAGSLSVHSSERASVLFCCRADRPRRTLPRSA